MPTYLFRRAEGFYDLRLKDDDDARRNAETNPGTVTVLRMPSYRVVWPIANSN